jgi:hypothetical protein
VRLELADAAIVRGELTVELLAGVEMFTLTADAASALTEHRIAIKNVRHNFKISFSCFTPAAVRGLTRRTLFHT